MKIIINTYNTMPTIRLIFKDHRTMQTFLRGVKPLPKSINITLHETSGKFLIIQNPAYKP